MERCVCTLKWGYLLVWAGPLGFAGFAGIFSSDGVKSDFTFLPPFLLCPLSAHLSVASKSSSTNNSSWEIQSK